MVICLERGADLHMAQLMPLPLTVSWFSKIQIGFTFLVPAHPGCPGKEAVKWLLLLLLLVLVNVIIDVTYFMSGIYSDFLTYLCGMQDYQSCNEVVDYRLVFKFQFHYYTKFKTHAKIKYT